MNVLDHECPSCGANIPFNPETQRWDCKYCGASYALEDFEKYEKEMQKEANATKIDSNLNHEIDMDEYECPNCGAKVVTDANTTATSCVYCASTNIIKNRLQGKFAPSKVIPFAIVKEKAVNEFYHFTKKKLFAPKAFCKKENIEEVKGVYIPFWLYDCYARGNIIANTRRIQTWRSGEYIHTKTDYYRSLRDGDMDFERVPADGSTKFADDIMDSIEPYNYELMQDFSPSYLSGFLAEKYDVSKEEAFKRARERIHNSTVEELKNSITGFNSILVEKENIDIELRNSEYVLMPVWLLNIRYRDKLYPFAMNGQTGKMVGNVPINPLKVILVASILEVVGIIVVLILKMLVHFLA